LNRCEVYSTEAATAFNSKVINKLTAFKNNLAMLEYSNKIYYFFEYNITMKKIVPCGVCGQMQILDAQKVTDTIQKYVDKPVDISEYDMVCHKCSQSHKYREKYMRNKWKKHFILGPKLPVSK
jgi:transcription elongation factor Elf1